MDFISEDNYCGQSLLRLVSRGNSILAELLRLSGYIPPAFLDNPPPEAKVFERIIQDFSYLKHVDEFEEAVQNDPELQEMDDTFREANIAALERFYNLFEGIYKYLIDYNNIQKDLEQGTYLHYNTESVFQEDEGRKLMCEALYLLGVMLLLLDEKIPGTVRERLLISYYRYKANAVIPNVDNVCSLCRATGYKHREFRPENYPEDYFARCAVSLQSVRLVISHLKDDDIYHQIPTYPLQEHRAVAMANQGSMIFVVLYFDADILEKENNIMRDIVNKFFPDNWVVAHYLGFCRDLSEEWATYKAARNALLSISLESESLKATQAKHIGKMRNMNKAINHYLKEGALNDEYVLQQSQKLLTCLRESNVTLRWLLLHRNTNVKQLRDIVNTNLSIDSLMQLLMHCSQFELSLRGKIEEMLTKRESQWIEDKSQAAIRMKDLADYYSGEKPLARGVKRNESYMIWFSEMEKQINSLDFADANGAIRRIQQLIQALEDMEQYHLEETIQIKQYLIETRNYMKHMVNVGSLQPEILQHMSRISDFSYAWDSMDEFIYHMQNVLERDPRSVLLLKATILKLSSILNVPLIRILQSNSPDLESVSDYYSKQLVNYVRKVLQVIPESVFNLLGQISEIQSKMQDIPAKIKKEQIKNYAFLEERISLSQFTHQIAMFTQGVLTMEKTLIGSIEVDPKQLLEDGIRRELVETVSRLFKSALSFASTGSGDLLARLKKLGNDLQYFQTAFEYIQDILGVFGLKIWQEELNRLINYNIEIEASTYMNVSFRSAKYQKEEIPVQKVDTSDISCITFMGKIVKELLALCDIRKNIFIEWMHGWYDNSGNEVLGLETITVLYKGLGIVGLSGVDRLLACIVTQNLKAFLRHYKASVIYTTFKDIWKDLQPISQIPEKGLKVYNSMMIEIKKIATQIHNPLITIGQIQLLRRLISYELNFRGRIDCPLLWSSLLTGNLSVLNDINHFPDFPPEGDELIPTLDPFLTQMGFSAPFEKIYIKPTHTPDMLPLVLALYTIFEIGSLKYDKRLSGLVRKDNEPIDGSVLVAGILTVLRQFHSDCFESYLGYLGQYINTSIESIKERKTTEGSKEKKPHEFPAEMTCTLVFIEELRKFAKMPRQAIERLLPSYILDKIPTL
jgi:WASH complex subunit strumpellin